MGRRYRTSFLVEHFLGLEGWSLHAGQLYCEVRLHSDEVQPQLDEYGYPCLEVAVLGEVHLRPATVSYRIVDETFRENRWLVWRK